jgi:hypothetical protein
MKVSGLAVFLFGALSITYIAADTDALAKSRKSSGFSRSGPASHGSVHTKRGDRRDTRRDHGDNRGERRERRGDVREERRERHEWYDDRWKRRVGASLTIAAFRALTCRPTTIILNGISYYSCGTGWYQKAYQGTRVVYVIVNPPPGY